MKTLDEIITEAIVHRMRLFGGNKMKAAKSLGIGRSTVYRFMSKHPEYGAEMRERREYGLQENELATGHR